MRSQLSIEMQELRGIAVQSVSTVALPVATLPVLYTLKLIITTLMINYLAEKFNVIAK